MSNEKPVVNTVLKRWLKPPAGLASDVDCSACALALKCCDFQPFWAGFAYGAMLEAGRRPVTVDPRKAVLQPIGVLATAEFRKLHATTGGGQACTFYDLHERRCGIWSFRPGECSFYFCTDDAKKSEREVWSARAFQLETSLAQMALAHLGYSPAAIAEQVDFLNAPPDALIALARPQAEEIYRAAWDWVRSVTPAEVAAWVDFDIAGRSG